MVLKRSSKEHENQAKAITQWLSSTVDCQSCAQEPVEESALIFYLVERDVQSPELAYMIAPRLAKDNLTLVFSEAVWAFSQHAQAHLKLGNRQ
eukprot:1041800-Amphidinium_carterae.1